VQTSPRPRSAGARPTSAFGHSTKNSSFSPFPSTCTSASPSSSHGHNQGQGQGIFGALSGLGSGTPPKSYLKGGVLYSCSDTDSYSNTLGPGYYNVADTLIKKSFNSRVSGGNSAKGSPTKTSLSTPPVAPQSGRTSPTGTYVSISPLAQHTWTANREKEKERERERVMLLNKSKGRGQGQGQGQMKAPTHTVMQGISPPKKSTIMRDRDKEKGNINAHTHIGTSAGVQGGLSASKSHPVPVPSSYRNRESKDQFVYQTPK
jgi:hypothetical protein